MYQIKVTPNYYQGTCGAPQEKYITNDDVAQIVDGTPNGDYEIAEWETEEEAQAIIDELEAGTYYLAHGEAGRPTYEIVEDMVDGEPDCYDASTVELGGYKQIAHDKLPTGIADDLDSQNVEYHKSCDDYDIYTAYATDDDGTKYAIAFCPRSVALQKNDDLGDIDWDNQAYFVED